MVIDFTTLNVSLRPVFGLVFFDLGCLCWQQHQISQRKKWMLLSFMAAQRGPKQNDLANLSFCLFTGRKTACFESAPDRHWNFYSVLPYHFSGGKTAPKDLCQVLASSPIQSYEEMTLLALNPLETIIFTSVAFQTVFPISAQRPILIFHCFPVACKGHKCSTD